MTVSVIDTASAMTAILDAAQDRRADLVREMWAPMSGMYRFVPGEIDLAQAHRQSFGFAWDARVDEVRQAVDTLVRADAWTRLESAPANRWWHQMSIAQQRTWKRDADDLLARWGEIHATGDRPDSERAQAHAARHLAWFAVIPGTPTHTGDPARSAEMVRGMADLYESNPDFHPSFGSREAAAYAATALRLHVERLASDLRFTTQTAVPRARRSGRRAHPDSEHGLCRRYDG